MGRAPTSLGRWDPRKVPEPQLQCGAKGSSGGCSQGVRGELLQGLLAEASLGPLRGASSGCSPRSSQRAWCGPPLALLVHLRVLT